MQHPDGNLAGQVAETFQTWSTPVDYDEVVIVSDRATVAVLGQSPLATLNGVAPGAVSSGDWWMRMIFKPAPSSMVRNDMYIALTDQGVSGFWGLLVTTSADPATFIAGNIDTATYVQTANLVDYGIDHEVVMQVLGGGASIEVWLDGVSLGVGAGATPDPSWSDFGLFLDNEFGVTVNAGSVGLVEMGTGVRG